MEWRAQELQEGEVGCMHMTGGASVSFTWAARDSSASWRDTERPSCPAMSWQYCAVATMQHTTRSSSSPSFTCQSAAPEPEGGPTAEIDNSEAPPAGRGTRDRSLPAYAAITCYTLRGCADTRFVGSSLFCAPPELNSPLRSHSLPAHRATFPSPPPCKRMQYKERNKLTQSKWRD